jgi:hypothetical protein
MEELYDSFLDSSSLRIKNFGKETTEDWARFVMNNRNRDFENYSDPLCNFDKYDIVIGPVADDNMAMLFRQYGGNYDKKKNTCYSINLLYDVVGGGDIQCTDDICGCRQDGGGQP